jgi:hypothetical protein
LATVEICWRFSSGSDLGLTPTSLNRQTQASGSDLGLTPG